MADAEALRPAFESWISASPFGRDVRRIPNDETRHAWPGQYRDIDVQLAWLAFERGVTAGVRASAPPEDSYPDQTVLHDERNVGNCLQATIAGVLGWPIGTVPHFALLGEEHWWDCAQAWLSAQGYWIDYKPDSYASEGGTLMPRCWLSGKTVRGTQHAVVGDSATGQMLHDPHPSRAGLVAVDYTIYFFRKPREVGAGRALHTGAIAALSRLMDGDPAPGTPQGDGLSLLADAIANYERATDGVSVVHDQPSVPPPTHGSTE